ncbi:hypothetical protein J7355_14585 [Endozoicomonas sp. G2_2]|uniref:hypothetical protein n=1 Tax=Endozoicomonas sp. G2_2 TaxID=2821092 RepID=UPI001ADBA960|nr:hypothetical protein [Endozoicomonas sp. G2_2]MBO9471319.1 hypothetical protein [Endozoicomonas sp. G2_2]
MHAKAHIDAEWGRHAPWHYDHHMGHDQNANWCVTRPWLDYITGSREIGDPSITESNPLGIRLPTAVEKPVNRLARRLLPHAYRRIEGSVDRARERATPLANVRAAAA